MKKFISVALVSALALSASITAFATDITEQTSDPKQANTAVNFNVDPTYTVIIPETVTLDQKTATDGTVTYEKDLDVKANSVRLLEGKKIEVTMDSDFNLDTSASSTYKLPYTVKVGDNTDAIESGATVAVFETNPQEQTNTLHFAAGNPIYAGDYSDNVTFNIKLV